MVFLILPLVPVVDLLSPLVFLLCLSQISLYTILPSQLWSSSFFHWSLLLTFSLHLSSSSVFLRSLFTQSSHLSCGLPHSSIGPCCWPSLSTCLPPLSFSDLSLHNPPILAAVFLILPLVPLVGLVCSRHESARDHH